MRKLAIFVEGYTELQFVDRLIVEIAGAHTVLIDHRKIRGGSSVPKSWATIRASNPASGHEYYVLLVDCGGDDLVKTRIMEEHERLHNSNYTKIIGIRDVRDKFTYADIPRLEQGLRTRIRTSLIPVEFVLPIMEIEAWFLSEYTHFERIDPAITLAAIAAAFGFHPQNDDLSLRPTPANDLDACYALAGKRYTKGTSGATVAALDCDLLYLELRNRIPYLDRLAQSIEGFLT
jgi:hypothetical protein